MKTIKFYPSNRKLIKLDGKFYKGYTINDVPYEKNAWFTYKGLTFVTPYHDQLVKQVKAWTV